jgi:hypothetical protein
MRLQPPQIGVGKTYLDPIGRVFAVLVSHAADRSAQGRRDLVVVNPEFELR